jgi:hypothetical protein
MIGVSVAALTIGWAQKRMLQELKHKGVELPSLGFGSAHTAAPGRLSVFTAKRS